MKKELFALLLLLLLALGALFNILYAERLIQRIEDQLELSQKAAEEENFPEALARLDAGLELLERSRDYTSIFIRHSELDSSFEAFFHLKELLLQEETAALPAAFSALRYKLRCLSDMEKPSLGSVL